MQPDDTRPPNSIVLRPLDAIGSSCQWFRRQLASLDITHRPDAGIGPGLSLLEDFRQKTSEGHLFKFKSAKEDFDYFMDAIATDALTKAIHWGHQSGLVLPRKRWLQLCKADPIVFRPGRPSKDRNQVWETLLASVVSSFASDVRFMEPDVVCNHQGKEFSIAAKVCYSPKNVSENVLKGFAQSEGKADAGIVFLDVAAIFPQVEEFDLSGFRNHTRESDVVERTKESIGRWCRNFHLEGWRNEASKLQNQPIGVAFFLPLLIQVEKFPVPGLFTHLPVCWGESSADLAFATSFVQACDHVLGFREIA